MSYSDQAIALLKERGYRITQPRRLVVDMLAQAGHSLSPYEIRDQLAALGESVDIVSIYRILECLEENQLIHRLLLQHGKVLKCQLDQESDCDLNQHDHCHHFLICRQCNVISEIHCVGLQPVVAEVSSSSGFQVENHHLEFVGLCQSCSETR